MHPARPRIQKEERSPEQKQQNAFADFENPDELEITNTTRTLQNGKLMRCFPHYLLIVQSRSLRNDRPFPAADFRLVAPRILEEEGVIIGS
jgi:hypothetical protein